MKNIRIAWGIVAMLMAASAAAVFAEPLQTGFTYQGVLEDGGAPVSGVYDISFTPYDTAFGGSPLDAALLADNVMVEGGLFTVELGVPPDGFTGDQIWLEIAVRPGASSDPADFAVLGPRQKITPVPYALHALSAGTVRYGSDTRTIGSLSPQASLSLGKVFFNYGFDAPPVVTVTGTHSGGGDIPRLIPVAANISSDGFELFVLNPSDFTYSSRPYRFNWIAAGNGSPLQTWYKDADGDGYSDGTRVTSYDQPPGFAAASGLSDTGGDCDDTDETIHPGANEIWYDNVDQDCDGRSDFDQDGDGFDSAAFGGGDCDDLQRWIHPGAMELLNGIDDDCDGSVDEDAVDRDCSDEMAAAFKASMEACLANGMSFEDCFFEAVFGVIAYDPCGVALINLFSCSPFVQLCANLGDDQLLACLYGQCPAEFARVFGEPVDADGDGYNVYQDCDDTDATVHPGAPEIWYDGKDQDCDGFSDFDQDRDGYDSAAYGGEDCDDGDPSVNPGAFDECGDGIDQDCDGSDRTCADNDLDGFDERFDCDDSNPAVFPGAFEIPYDFIDQDCDGMDLTDVDGDGFDAWEAGGEDCDDTDPDINPDAIEVPYNGKDDDCDGLVDEGDVDYDSDGFPGYDDCDDTNASINPEAPETWYDGIDQNCDALNDYDQDGDGFEAEPWGTDCDDIDPFVNPGRPELIGDGIDNDCDGEVDEFF